jgi:hypothetical protein
MRALAAQISRPSTCDFCCGVRSLSSDLEAARRNDHPRTGDVAANFARVVLRSGLSSRAGPWEAWRGARALCRARRPQARSDRPGSAGSAQRRHHHPGKGRSQDREPGDREPEHDADIRLGYRAASMPAASARPGAWHFSLLRAARASSPVAAGRSPGDDGSRAAENQRVGYCDFTPVGYCHFTKSLVSACCR